MNIQEIIDKISKTILKFKFEDFFKGSKIVALIIAAIAMVIILFGILFSLIPQF